MSRAKMWSVVGLIVIVGMVLAACQPQTQTVTVVTVVAGTPVVKTETKVVTATPVPPTAVPTKPPAKAVDTVVLALQQEPDTGHPLIGSMMAKVIVLSSVNPGCMVQNEKTEWVPIGCEQVPTFENGGAKFVGEGADKHLEITYKIRKGWRWHDGAPVTSKDAVYSWKLQMDLEFEVAGRDGTEKIYEVVAVDDSTFVTKFMSEKQAHDAAAGTLKGAIAFDKFKDDYVASGYDKLTGPVVDPVYWNLGWAGTGGQWVPAHILEKVPAKDHKTTDYAKKPIGDGAFAVKEWKSGQEIVLERSDKPWPLGEPKIKTIIFRFFAETKAVIAALQKGEIDAATSVAGLTPSDSPDLDKIGAAGMYKVEYHPEYSWEHIDINTTKFPFDDLKVRQALYYATDKKALVDALYFGKQALAPLPGAVLPTNSWAYTDNYTKYDFNLDKAKALLKEAGWDCAALPCTKKVTEGGKEVTKRLEFTLMTTDRADRQKLAQAIQAQWKKLNVGVNLQFLYGRGLFATCSAGGPMYCRTYDAAIYTLVGSDDPQFWGQYNCAAIPTKENNWSGGNWPAFCNQDAEAAIKASELTADITVSRDKRKPYIEKFFQAFTADVPVIPLFVNTVPIVYRTGFKNYYCGPTNFAACGWNAWQWELSK